MNRSIEYERLEKPIIGTELKVFQNIAYSTAKEDIANVSNYLEDGRDTQDIEEYLQCNLTCVVAICLIDGEEIGKNETGEDNDDFKTEKIIDNDDIAGIETELGLLRIANEFRIPSFRCAFDGARAVHYVSKVRLDELRKRKTNMDDENVKQENILKILKLLTQDSGRLEDLLAEFLQQVAIREFDGEQPLKDAEKEALKDEMRHD